MDITNWELTRPAQIGFPILYPWKMVESTETATTLERIPFQLNADDRSFDMHTVIQCRALGVPIREVPVLPAWREYGTAREALGQLLRDCATAVDYRLHQLHLTLACR